MTLIKIGDTLINADNVTHVAPDTAMGASAVLGYTVHFIGGGKLVLADAQFLAKLEAWAVKKGWPIAQV